MPIPVVVDLSHHNTIPKDFTATRQAGVVGVIHKMTEGSGYIDDEVAARRFLAREAGMAWGLYHFLRPGNMVEQADFFIGSALELGVFDADTLVAADHEDPGVSLEDLMAFLDAVEMRAERACVIYSGHVLKEQLSSGDYDLSDYRLWLAQYAAEPELPAGFDVCWLWQYTDKGEIPGISPPTDLNASDLTIEALLASWSGMALPPVPVPAPEPELYVATVRITSSAPIDIAVEHGVVRYSKRGSARTGEPIFNGPGGRPSGPQRPDGTSDPSVEE